METADQDQPVEKASPSTSFSDSEIARLFRVDEDSVEHLYLSNLGTLVAIAIRNFDIPPDEARTLAHDVFLTYLVNRRDVPNPRAYLIGGIKKACLHFLRRKYTHKRVLTDTELRTADERHAATQDDFSEELSTNHIVTAVLSRLDDRCREVLSRYYLEDEPTPQIAQALDTSPGDVNYLVHKCRKRARAIYESLTQVPE